MKILTTIFLYIKNKFTFTKIFWILDFHFKGLQDKAKELNFKTRKLEEKYTVTTMMIRNLFINNLWLISFVSFISLCFLALPKVLLQEKFQNNEIIQVIKPLIISIPPDSKSAYDGLLIVIITVIGIMLTIFLTNISTAVGSVYANLSRDIRELFLKDKISKWYTDYLIILMMVFLIFLGGAVFDDIRPRFITLIIIFLSLYSIQAFSLLGNRSFLLLNLSYIQRILRQEFNNNAVNTTIKGSEWLDVRYQEYYHNKAKSILEQFNFLTEEVYRKATTRNISLKDSIGETALLINNYLALKQKIPINSKWYEKKAKFQQWFLSSTIHVSLATNTQTDLLPEFESDAFWVENSLLDELYELLNSFLNQEDFLNGLNILQTTLEVLINMSNWLENEYAINKLKLITEPISRIKKIESSSLQFIDKQPIINQKLGFIDFIGWCLLEMLLITFNKIKDLDPKLIQKKLSILDWKNQKSVYSINFPRPLLAQIEEIWRKINFETLIEGERITSNWYISKIILSEIEIFIQKELQNLLEGSKFLFNKIEQYSSEKGYIEAVTLIIKLFEFTNKFQYHFSIINSMWINDLEYQNTLKRSSNPKGWESLEKDILSLENNLYKNYAELIPALSNIEPREDLPDYLGRSVHVVGQRCFSALINKEYSIFNDMYKFYFQGSINETEILKNKLKTNNQSVNFFLAPLIELLDFSGYAYFCTKLFQDKKYFNIIEKYWNLYITRNPKEILEYISSVIRYEKKYFIYVARSSIRSTWNLEITNLIKKFPIKESRNSPLPMLSMEIDHPDELVKKIVGNPKNSHFSFDGIDIFTVKFLYGFDHFSKIDFGSIESLYRKLEE